MCDVVCCAVMVIVGNQLNGMSHPPSSYVHGNTGAWPAVAQWGGDVRQSRSNILIGPGGDQHKEMADMFNLMDNTPSEFNDLTGMFNSYS